MPATQRTFFAAGVGAGSAFRRGVRYGIRCVSALALLALLTAPLAVPAHAREILIRSFHAELVVMPDSSLDVTETIRVEFVGSWQGLYRTIPVEYPGIGGFNYSLFLSGVNASEGSEGSGAPLRIEQHRQAGSLQLKIYVPAAQDAIRVISLHYQVRNALRFFEDHDELYWNVTGNSWDAPIAEAAAHIVLPAGVSGLHAADFTGAFGARASAALVEILGSNVDIRTTRPLAFHEGLTVVVGWDKGFVQAPDNSEKIRQFLLSNWPLFLPLLVSCAMLWLWYTRGRDPRVGSIAVQYEPPAGLTPGEAGTLVDNRADLRDIMATLVDLAVHGYLAIEETQADHLMGLYSNKDYTFHLLKKPAEWVAAKPHELLLLAGIFSGGDDRVALSDLQNKFYKNLPPIRDAIFESLLTAGYYAHRPDRVRQTFLAASLMVGALVYGVGLYAAQRLGMQTQPFVISAVLTGFVIYGLGWFMPAHTAEGARAKLNVLGFEDFLGHVEADRMDRMNQTPATFEKYLPFAMALGVEKKWVGAFEGICTQPPSWYVGPSGSNFHAIGFVNSLDQMSVRAGQVMSSAPRSAGSSGFGGGGSSGGGFGGGGGGGF